MRVLLLKYNKVTNEALEKFVRASGLQFKWADLASFGCKMDTLNQEQVSGFLSRLLPFDAMIIGDIFWPSGQEICNWSTKNKIRSFFLQHGQWVYTANKQSPRHLPYCTCVYGENIKNEILDWPYGKCSKVEATGNPRYDNLVCREGDYVYFSPPVMLELNSSAKSIFHPKHEKMIKRLCGIDKRFKVVIHPHYREGKQHLLQKLFPKAEFVNSSASALDVIVGSKCVLTHRNSTVVLDAIACSKRVVLMNFGERSCYPLGYFAPFAAESSNFNECVSNLEQQAEMITDYKEKSRPHLVLEGASIRIEQLIKESEKYVDT